ncbi:MAG: hypothetical protein OEY72_11060, partial [Gammaproteobacteria bacterium]|nr:hypothetical protein [Gammaproteobacteria bacterium]
MTESTTTKDASSLPLLLTLSGAVLVVAVGGWFLLEPDVPDAPAYQDSAIDMAKLPENAATPERVVADSEQVTIEATDIETQLRKARLASAAEILIFPRDQSALHYYGSVLAADPQHAVANAELDTMLAGVAQTVEDHLAEGEYAEAYAIASLVAEARPEHSLVTGTRQALDSYKEQRILEAIEQARDGKDDEASATLALAQALPGRRADEFATVKSTIADIKAAREAAEQDRRQRAQLAANDARAAWVNRIETAIQQGNLIAPAGSSAKDLLAERNSWRSERERLAGELITALKLGTELEIAAGRLPAAEKLLAAAIELGGESDDFADLQELLESALVEAESNRVRRL